MLSIKSQVCRFLIHVNVQRIRTRKEILGIKCFTSIHQQINHKTSTTQIKDSISGPKKKVQKKIQRTQEPSSLIPQIVNCTWDHQAVRIYVSAGCAFSDRVDISSYADSTSNTWSAVGHIRTFCDVVNCPGRDNACDIDRIRIGFSSYFRRVAMMDLKGENFIVNGVIFYVLICVYKPVGLEIRRRGGIFFMSLVSRGKLIDKGK